MDYSIIIPAFNEEKLLPETLRDLRESMRDLPGTGQLIVVDNNSTDRTAEIARKHGAEVVQEPVNQISRARNTGARASLGRYLIFIDADTRAPRALIESAIRALRTGRVCGGGAAVQMDKPLGKIGCGIVAFWNWVSSTFKLAAGSFVYCTRQGFEEIGGFSERVYAGEEIFFSQRLKKWGVEKGLQFRILSADPVITSSRKIDWFGEFRLLQTAILMVVFPAAIYKRSACSIWYTRPAGAK